MHEFDLAVLGTFGSRKKCCEYMGWSASTYSKISKKKRPLRADEIDKLNLKIKATTYAEFKEIFFDF